MTYPAYASDLQRIHASEVYGVALFDAAAAVTRDRRRHGAWVTLHALEVQTLERYLAFMAGSDEPVRAPTGWALRGKVEGAALGCMPWRVAMRLLAKGTQPFQASFRRLVAHASPGDADFFAYVLAHEEAIEAFALAELEGRADSLARVTQLLPP